MSDETFPSGIFSEGHRAAGESLERIAERLRESRRATTLAILSVLQAQIVEELSTTGRGRQRSISRAALRAVYRRKNREAALAKARAHAGRASAPGDPPAPDYGKLRGSIQIEYDETLRLGRCGTNDAKAPALNFGTTKAGKRRNVVILPRPFMEPALKKALPAMTEAGLRGIHTVVRSAVRG